MFWVRRKLPAVLVLALVFMSFETYSQDKTAPPSEIRALIGQLSGKPWRGAQRVGESLTAWEFNLTEPMKRILETGGAAQTELLKRIDDAPIKDQVIFLLGGVGDERAIAPIIDAMIPESEFSATPSARKINSTASLALTNITVADVIWHHGGGIVIDKCAGREKECWAKWWKENKRTFTVKGITQSRNYSNYPGYGIYGGRN